MPEYPSIPWILFQEGLWLVESWDNPEYARVSQDSKYTFHDDLQIGWWDPGIIQSIPGFQEYFSMQVSGWWNPGIILSMPEYPKIPRIIFQEGLKAGGILG